MRASSALLLLAFVAAASAYTWDSCGTQYDRLQTASLTFSACEHAFLALELNLVLRA